MPAKRLLITLLSAPALLLAACSSGDGDAAPVQPTPASNQPAATQSVPTQTTGGNETAQIAGAYAQVRSFRVTMVVETPGAPAQTSTVAVVLPDRQHVTFSQAGVTFEVIAIGSNSYYKIGPTWTRQPLSGATVQMFDTTGIAGLVQGLQAAGATRGGTANVEGKTCQVYTIASGGGSQEFCVADNLPIRIVTQAGAIKTTMTFRDYNAAITIDPPI